MGRGSPSLTLASGPPSKVSAPSPWVAPCGPAECISFREEGRKPRRQGFLSHSQERALLSMVGTSPLQPKGFLVGAFRSHLPALLRRWRMRNNRRRLCRSTTLPSLTITSCPTTQQRPRIQVLGNCRSVFNMDLFLCCCCRHYHDDKDDDDDNDDDDGDDEICFCRLLLLL